MLALGRAGVVQIFISQPIMDEIAGVLVREFRWAPSRVREAARATRGFAILASPGESVTAVREDEPDHRILECAIAAHADAIVTGDQHLLKLTKVRDIMIVSPRGLLDARRRPRRDVFEP